MRHPPPRDVVPARPGDRIYARRASAQERADHDLQLGDYVMVIGERVICPADKCLIEVGDGAEAAGEGGSEPDEAERPSGPEQRELA